MGALEHGGHRQDEAGRGAAGRESGGTLHPCIVRQTLESQPHSLGR